jgi:TonB family protein
MFSARGIDLVKPMRMLVIAFLAIAVSASSAEVRVYRFTGNDLKAHLVHFQRPEYPSEARRAYQQGLGYFLYVARNGNVTTVQTLKTTEYQMLDSSALRALATWRMEPGPRREVDVPVIFLVASGPHASPLPNERLPTILREFRE